MPDDRLDAYDFDLPAGSIAQRPLSERSDSRMLVVDRAVGDPRHLGIRDLPDQLQPGDLLVANDTRVLPARLFATRATGGKAELLAVEPLEDGAWACMVRPSARIAPGAVLTLRSRARDEIGPTIVVGERREDGTRTVRGVRGPLAEALDGWGEMPLPPYIARQTGPAAEDRERYQTVFARVLGAVAAPTAGLHFDDALRDRLARRGVREATVTLHVGAGTFAPVRAADLAAHPMHRESYQVPVATALAVDETLAAGGRVVAVGTTSLRSLESWHRAGRPRDGAWRSTDLFLRPGHPPLLDAALLTNFHLPRSTLLMLVASLLGRERTLSIYADAAARGYRFYSYGDCSLLL